MDPEARQLVRDMSASLGMDFGTTAPYEMGGLQIEKVGFGNVPLIFVMATFPRDALPSMIPVARQFVFRELAGAGLENEIMEFVPTVQEQGRGRCRFTDRNEHSPTLGKFKMGVKFRIAFEIKKPFLAFFTWDGFCNQVGHLPEHK